MTPPARVQAAIEILDAWMAGSEGLDRVLAAWGRTHRFAGSGDRRRIADLVYDGVRRRRSSAWVAGTEDDDPRGVIRGSLMQDGTPLEPLFDGSRYGPPAMTEEERVVRELHDAPRAVQLDYPDWLDPGLAHVAEPALSALRAQAPVDLRVNSIKVGIADVSAVLREEGIVVEPICSAPLALRVTEGARRVAASRAYSEGLVEIQDAASQRAATFAGAKPGMTVLDLCAGGGGKTLALGADMKGQGRLIAHDISTARMKDLPQRAARAGLRVDAIASADLSELSRQCDLVVVDAPCSGTGAWRRNPDHKWRLTANELERLEGVQVGLLEQAIGLCAPGGQIVYMTCSILERENGVQIERFLDRRPDWTRRDELVLSPADGTDGFYAARLRATAR
ncbi:MAG: RsmB/NOP family class I SAM-dependent RNA methyltransferase [Pseudomonadota bacterium]